MAKHHPVRAQRGPPRADVAEHARVRVAGVDDYYYYYYYYYYYARPWPASMTTTTHARVRVVGVDDYYYARPCTSGRRR